MTTPDPGADYWMTDEVAAYLKVDASTVRSYHARKQMPLRDRTFGRANAWRPATIIAWHGSRPRVGAGT